MIIIIELNVVFFGIGYSKGFSGKSKKIKLVRANHSHATTYLVDSTLTGVSSIVKSKGCCRRLVKAAILVSSVAGFLYQTFGFLDLYWQYSTVNEDSPLKSINKPVVTICDENLMRRIYLCETKYDKCLNFSEMLDVTNGDLVNQIEDYISIGADPGLLVCKKFGAYCTDYYNIYKRMPVPYKITYGKNEKIEYFNWNFTKDSGFSMKENLISCIWTYNERLQSVSDGLLNTTCAEPIYVRGLTKEKLPGACYTLDSSIGNNKYSEKDLSYAMAEIVLTWNPADLINIEPDDASFFDVYATSYRAYYLSFHSPGELSNPFVDGIRIEERKKYKILLSQNDYRRMPSPYSTHCFDYWSTWRKNNGKGPLRKQDCQGLCVIEKNWKTYNCVPREVNYPHEFPLCLDNLPHNYKLRMEIQQCAENCRDACYEIVYKAEEEIVGEVTHLESYNKYKAMSAVHIEIDFNVLMSVETVTKPKYETVELFSYIGGYLGMWLGWSLMAIFDFFEILFYIGQQLFSRQKRKMKITNVRHFSVDY